VTGLEEVGRTLDTLGAAALDGAIVLAFALLSGSLALAAWRLVRGPSVPDRIVALELIASLFVGVIALASIATGVSAYLDVAIALTLVAFLGAVVLARFLVRRRFR
jgi:multicomponent Na+:H+ antiporter subunit F